MKRIVVLGLGNRLMRDDGVGVAVVEALAEHRPVDEQVTYAVGETDFDYCLEEAMNADFLVVVDAAITGERPGAVSVLPLCDMSATRPGLSQHHAHFLDLLRQVDQQKTGVLIGIEPFQVDFGWGLSQVLAQQLSFIIEEVQSVMARHSCSRIHNLTEHSELKDNCPW